MKVLIDGDVVCYRAAYAVETTKYLRLLGSVTQVYDDMATAKADLLPGEALWSRKEVRPKEDAMQAAQSVIMEIARNLEADPRDLVIVLSGIGNFRYKYATRADYKGNRSGERPKHYNLVRSYLAANWEAVITAGEEADDRLGIMMTAEPNSVCCSIDKDLLQLPGWHYNIRTDKLFLITPREAAFSFYRQILTGDSADNIPGLPGIGPVKAAAALADCWSPWECWEMCVRMYAEEFKPNKGKQYALEAARLLYIRKIPGDIWNPTMAAKQWADAVDLPCPVKPLQFSPIADDELTDIEL